MTRSMSLVSDDDGLAQEMASLHVSTRELQEELEAAEPAEVSEKDQIEGLMRKGRRILACLSAVQEAAESHDFVSLNTALALAEKESEELDLGFVRSPPAPRTIPLPESEPEPTDGEEGKAAATCTGVAG